MGTSEIPDEIKAAITEEHEPLRRPPTKLEAVDTNGPKDPVEALVIQGLEDMFQQKHLDLNSLMDEK